MSEGLGQPPPAPKVLKGCCQKLVVVKARSMYSSGAGGPQSSAQGPVQNRPCIAAPPAPKVLKGLVSKLVFFVTVGSCRNK